MRTTLTALFVLLASTACYAEEPTFHAGFDETDYGKDGPKAGFANEEDEPLQDADGKTVPQGLQKIYRERQKDDAAQEGEDEGFSDAEKEPADGDYGDEALARYQKERMNTAMRMQRSALGQDGNETADQTEAVSDYAAVITGTAQDSAPAATTSGGTGYYDLSGYYKAENAGIFDAETSYLSESN